MRLFLIAVIGFVLVLPAGSAPGADQTEKARAAYALSRELMSPFCPGRTLSDCPSPSASAVREEIREKIYAGVPPADVKREIEARFGIAVQGTPGSAIGWALPTIALILGAAAVVFALVRLSRRDTPSSGEEPLPPDLEREIDEEIRESGL
jgi:cytochrome c-type biogenesis protein CcmH/NrfF